MTLKLLNGDCWEMLKALPGNSIDACVTDPAYLEIAKTRIYHVLGADLL